MPIPVFFKTVFLKAKNTAKQSFCAFFPKLVLRIFGNVQKCADSGLRHFRDTFWRRSSDSGALYGSVSPRDAAEVATSAGFSIDRKQISLVKPIKELGLHEMSVVLHPEVTATIILNVARSTEEADLQASGKSILDVAAEAEAEAEFEIAELFDDIGSAALEEDNDDDQVSNAPVEDSEEISS